MWGMSEIDNLLNPEFDKVSDYRKLFRVTNTYIAVDNATRNQDDSGEVHLLLLVRDNRLGLLSVHDQYAEGLPPMFCEPGHESVIEFHKRLEDAIEWFDTPQELLEYFREQKHFNNPVYSKSPLIMGFFIHDAMDFVRQRFQIPS